MIARGARKTSRKNVRSSARSVKATGAGHRSTITQCDGFPSLFRSRVVSLAIDSSRAGDANAERKPASPGHASRPALLAVLPMG